MLVLYSGRVQGVGFRYTVKMTATGFELTGTVRNLLDGRVELTAEGAREELDEFRQAIRDAGLNGFIRDEQGQDLVEYALIVAAVGLALITTVNQLSQGIVSLYQSITGDLSSIGAQQ